MKFIAVLLLTFTLYAQPIKIDSSINMITTLSTISKIMMSTKTNILIEIDSPGGYVALGNIIIDTMNMAQLLGHVITCKVTGIAGSMAFTILQECDNRIGTPNAVYMTHSMYSIVNGQKVSYRDDPGNIYRIAREKNRINLTLDKYLTEFVDTERFFNSLEALSINAIDEIGF